MNLIRILLVGLELFHAALHLQVLFGVEKLYTIEELRNNGSYFIFDAATVVTSATFLVLTINRRRSTYKRIRMRRWIIFINMLLHLSLHVYYIINWQQDNNYWVNAIRKWSAEGAFQLRMLQHGVIIGMINWFGTCFDIFVHLFMTAQLLSY